MIPLYASTGRTGAQMFYREKKTDCGAYREADIIPRTDNAERAVKGKRGKKRKATEPKQKDLNDKNAKRYLVQLGNGNFGIGDLHVSCTYNAKNLPESVEEAERIVSNYLRRIAYRRNKLGLPPLKYILVTEYKFAKDGEQIKRIHHHIIMNGGLSRDDVEMMWTKERINWRKVEKDPQYKVSPLGYANADRLQPNEYGCEAIARYMTKEPLHSGSFVALPAHQSVNSLSFITLLYAGRMILFMPMISSIRCALQPTILAMAKSGVYNSVGIPSISYTNPL